MEAAEPEVLQRSQTRRRVYELIRSRPGLSVSELARCLDIYWTAAALHLAALERAQLVTTRVVGRRRILMPAEGSADLIAIAAGMLREAACFRVAVAIAEQPDRRVWELCEILDMSDRAVYHHVKRLVASGLVVSAQPGRYRGLRASASLLAAIARTP